MGIVSDLGSRFNDTRARHILADYSTFSKWRIILLSQDWMEQEQGKGTGTLYLYAGGIIDIPVVTIMFRLNSGAKAAFIFFKAPYHYESARLS